MKKAHNPIIFLYIFFCIAGSAFATPSFNGQAGIKGDMYANPESDDFEPAMTAQGYFTGQLNFTKRFFVRAEFALQTEDMAKNTPIKSTGATFSVNEFSATLVKPILGIVQYFNVFFGTYEPIGKDYFLQRQFGIQPISSLTTDSWWGTKGPAAYAFFGGGGSYIVRMNSLPVATGAYIYINKENEERNRQANLDWRVATVLRYLTADFAVGISAPMEQKNGNNDVILLIDSLFMHAGGSLLLGNRYTTSLLVQGGFENLQMKAGDTKYELKSKDLFLLVEPRFVTRLFQFHITLFNIPEEKLSPFMFIEDTFGVNVALFTENLYVKNKNITFGFHVTWSVTDKVSDTTINQNINKNFMDLKEVSSLIKDCDHHIKITPFLSIPVMDGALQTMLQVKVTDIDNDTWQDAFIFTLGYKAKI